MNRIQSINCLRKYLLPIVTVSSMILSSCGETKYGSGSAKGKSREELEDKLKEDGPGKKIVDTGDSTAKVPTQPPVSDEVKEETLEGASFRVKNSKELRDSIESCIGTGLLELKPAMEKASAAATPAPNAEGQFAFLAPGFMQRDGAQKDVINRYAVDLYEPSQTDRLSTNANALTQTYMSSLALVADVVAYNCDIGANKPCDCSSEANALKIVSACVPHLDDMQRKDVAGLLNKSCQGTPVAKRSAMASFIASTLFAEKK